MPWSDAIIDWQSKYFDFEADQSLGADQLLHNEKEALIPKTLFKYGHLNNNRENRISCLRWSRIWLANPRNFNDPFDCLGSSNTLNIHIPWDDLNPMIDLMERQFPKEQIRNQLNLTAGNRYTIGEILNRIDAADPDMMATQAIRAVLENQDRTQFAEGFKTYRERQLICCFNETHQSLPMWAHYAANHTGFCVEYDFHHDFTNVELRNCLYPVIYSNNRVDIGHVGTLQNPNHLRIYTRMMNSKALDWSYEKEWRFIHPAPYSDRNSPVVDGKEYKGPKITGIYLGLEIGGENERELLQRANDLKVQCLKGVRSNSGYTLEFERIN